MAKKKKTKKQEYQKQLILCLIMAALSIGLGLFIHNTNILDPKIDELTTSFISFNNKYTTDMLKINNIVKMSNKIGKSSWNPHSLSLDILPEKDSAYEIVLYPLNNSVEEEYIWYSLEDKKELVNQNLSNLEKTEDGGIILYKGNSKRKRITLRLWISNNYKKEVTENLFEVKVIPR